MYYTRCIHPPGGVTALAAVIGGQNIHGLGYQYILTPIAINTAIILMVVLLFNALFHWLHYPAFLLSKETEKDYTNCENAPAIMLILFMHPAKWTFSLMLPKMIC